MTEPAAQTPDTKRRRRGLGARGEFSYARRGEPRLGRSPAGVFRPLHRAGPMSIRVLLRLISAGLFAVMIGTGGARADGVDLLLVLAADVSRSINDEEFALQRKGYAAALTDPKVLRAIAGGPHQTIALTFIEWSGATDQKVVVDWTVVHDEEDAGAIAAAILAAPRSFLSRTSISAAIDFSMERFAAGPGPTERRIIDISGDGTSNAGRLVTDARDDAVHQGVTINGLAIINTQINPGFALHTQPPGGLPNYYKENVIGGPGAFLLVVENFDTFAEAMTRKLISEIAMRRQAPSRAAALKQD
jgi:hypothetical protein